eukprot:1188579-Prorocentrum_minimum.AAC.2
MTLTSTRGCHGHTSPVQQSGEIARTKIRGDCPYKNQGRFEFFSGEMAFRESAWLTHHSIEKVDVQPCMGGMLCHIVGRLEMLHNQQVRGEKEGGGSGGARLCCGRNKKEVRTVVHKTRRNKEGCEGRGERGGRVVVRSGEWRRGDNKEGFCRFVFASLECCCACVLKQVVSEPAMYHECFILLPSQSSSMGEYYIANQMRQYQR